jgi:Raf kinase inhibitor-like YbhB/YbcL family protein
MFTLKCSSYADGGTIPLRFAHRSVQGGENVSPGFSWEDPPPGTKSFALSIMDPHPVANNWVHWFVIDIPFQERGIREGASRGRNLPPQAKELLNSYNEMGYGGPAPPKGSGPHPYIATLYALDVSSLPLGKDTLLSAFLRAVEGKSIAEISMKGYHERK